jgi:hypothetical protein
MPRSKARIKNLFGEIVIIKKNPWHHPRLVKALASIGKRPKKPEYILASPPPWFGNPQAMPKGVYERAKLFSEVASETRGMPIENRLKIISKRLKTGRKERESKAKPKEELFHVKYPTYEALRRVAPAPTPTQTPEARAPTFRE